MGQPYFRLMHHQPKPNHIFHLKPIQPKMSYSHISNKSYSNIVYRPTYSLRIYKYGEICEECSPSRHPFSLPYCTHSIYLFPMPFALCSHFLGSLDIQRQLPPITQPDYIRQIDRLYTRMVTVKRRRHSRQQEINIFNIERPHI